MSAIQGTFTKIEPVASRKIARLHIELPIEKANEALEILGGYPDPANPEWVGIARLSREALMEPKPEPKSYTTLAAVTCASPAYWKHLADNNALTWSEDPKINEENAANFVRNYCGVKSRAHIIEGTQAAQLWRELYLDYQNWLKE